MIGECCTYVLNDKRSSCYRLCCNQTPTFSAHILQAAQDNQAYDDDLCALTLWHCLHQTTRPCLCALVSLNLLVTAVVSAGAVCRIALMIGISVVALSSTACAPLSQRLTQTHRDFVWLWVASVPSQICVAPYLLVGWRSEGTDFVRCPACHRQLVILAHICL